jgi:hypothetical protein
MKIHKSHKSKWPWPVYAEVARRLLWEFQKERAIPIPVDTQHEKESMP